MTVAFTSYRIYYHTAPQYNWDAMIDLYGATGAVGRLLFMKAGQAIPANTQEGTFIRLYYSAAQLPNILQILWHESPLYINLNTANGIGTLSTSSEPIGEEE